jgi:hypothetical protein
MADSREHAIQEYGGPTRLGDAEPLIRGLTSHAEQDRATRAANGGARNHASGG